MRFSAIHKVSSYLMVACAFIPLALSGELSPILLLATVLLAAGSFFVEPARMPLFRSRGWTWTWNLLTLAMCAWRVGEWLRGEPLIISGVYFLCFLLVNKLWNRRTSKDYLQAYVVSFLMLVAGTTLNTGLVYALAFVGYVVFATWTLTMFHLRREMEENYLLKHSDDAQSERVAVERILNSRRVVGGSFLFGTALVALGIFAGSSFIFFLFPRVEFGALFGHRRPGILTTGFSDRIELGHHGLVKDNPQVIMRVQFPSGSPPSEPLRFRGVAFDTYDRGRWSRSAAGHGALPRRGGAWVVPSEPGDDVPDNVLGGTLTQEVYLEPLDTPVLFGASRPVAFALSPARPGMTQRVEGGASGEAYAMSFDERGRPQPPSGGRRYTAFSRITEFKPSQIAEARPLTREEQQRLGRYLALPPDLPPRVRELAHQLTASAPTAAAKADAVSRHLHGEYRYTQRLGRNPRYEPLEDFLFEQKAGHCEYFASAMAVLLRVAGVPTRSVNGFYGGEWNAYGNYLALRQGDAHAWVEVYLGGVGWVTYDPTPPVVAGGDGPSVLDRLRQIADTVQLAWFKYVIEYDLAKQIDLFSGIRRWFSGDSSRTARGRDAAQSFLKRNRGYVMIGVIVVLAAGIVIWRRRRRAAAAGPRVQIPRRALGAVERALRALERRGLTRREAETLVELAARAEAKHDPGSTAFRQLVEHYYEVRFGGAPLRQADLDRLAAEVARPPTKPARLAA